MSSSNNPRTKLGYDTPQPVAFGSVYEGSTTVYHMPLGNDMVKVCVEEVQDVDAQVPVPTKKVQLVEQTLNTFIA